MHSIDRRFLVPARAAGACALAAFMLLAGCMGSQSTREPPIDPDVARASIARLLPKEVTNRAAWAADIFAAFEALELQPTVENTCATIAVTAQESTFQAQPSVPGLPAIARREIETRASRYGVPKVVARAALDLRSPNGLTYNQRLDKATTEKELSDVFEDFIGMVPLGTKLFADLNPVRTGGPMQVSIEFAEQHAAANRYPYPAPNGIREEVFTRRGGLYFGIAHLLDYPAGYDDMVFRFADYNAGHYASRNVAFQNAVNVIAKTQLDLDGDLLRHGAAAHEPSNTELAIRKLASAMDMTDVEIRRDLERGDEAAFERTRLYAGVFALADKTAGKAQPRAIIPKIRLQSPKITRKLTTEWFARRVDERYERCLAQEKATSR
jgi:hypothetical protein